MTKTKVREVTATDIRHGTETGEVVNIPAGTDFSKHRGDFNDEEYDQLVAAGAVAPMAEVNDDLANENEVLAARVATLEAQLTAANSKANLHAGNGSGAVVSEPVDVDAEEKAKQEALEAEAKTKAENEKNDLPSL